MTGEEKQPMYSGEKDQNSKGLWTTVRQPIGGWLGTGQCSGKCVVDCVVGGRDEGSGHWMESR